MGGRAVPYPDPKIVTVAATTNNVNTTRSTPPTSPPSTAAHSPHLVTLKGG
jgi:hypothetical protein